MEGIEIVHAVKKHVRQVAKQACIGIADGRVPAACEVLERFLKVFDLVLIVGHFLPPDLVVHVLEASLVAVVDRLFEGDHDGGFRQKQDLIFVVQFGAFDRIRDNVATEALELLFAAVPVKSIFVVGQIRHTRNLADQLQGHPAGGFDEAWAEMNIVPQIIDAQL